MDLPYTFSVELYSILAALSIFILLIFECSVDCALSHCPKEWFYLPLELIFGTSTLMDNQDTREKHMEKISDAFVHVMSNKVIYKFSEKLISKSK